MNSLGIRKAVRTVYNNVSLLYTMSTSVRRGLSHSTRCRYGIHSTLLYYYCCDELIM